MSLLELPGVSEQVPAWCHDFKHNWQAESHLAFATHTYSKIYLCAALSVYCVASAVLCYKDKALWRLQRPWEDESNFSLTGRRAFLSHNKCNNLFLKKDTKRTQRLVCIPFRKKYILHILNQQLLSDSKRPGSNTTQISWIHICYGQRHCWWAQTVMWHLNILIKNACFEGKQRGALGAPARED